MAFNFAARSLAASVADRNPLLVFSSSGEVISHLLLLLKKKKTFQYFVNGLYTRPSVSVLRVRSIVPLLSLPLLKIEKRK